jgi:Flp pilus assembly protein TadG
VRVLLTRSRDERGAVAVAVAPIVLVLLICAGFVTDFGAAYVSKRQLQTASDSAALAAASVYAESNMGCAAMVADTGLRAIAQQRADEYRLRNRPGSVASPAAIDVACVDGNLRVTVTAAGTTATAFAPMFGGTKTITTARTATSALEPTTQIGTGLRPLGICSADLPDGGAITGNVVRINAPGDGHSPPAGCPVDNPGNWWTLDCPEERIGGTSLIEQEIKFGCNEPVSIVDQSAATTPANRTSILVAACPNSPLHSEKCLSGDPGGLDSGQIEAAWSYLIDNQVRITMPIFCAPPVCSGSTVQGTGTNAVFPVHKLAAIVVCGYHFGKQSTKQYQPNTNPDCAIDQAGEPPVVTTDNSTDNYMVVVYKRVLVSGGTGPSTCQLGDATCDTGLRRVRLVN